MEIHNVVRVEQKARAVTGGCDDFPPAGERLEDFVKTGEAAPVGATVAGQQQLYASEDIEYLLLPIQAIQKSIENGEFSQALHIASYYRCIHHAASSSSVA